LPLRFTRVDALSRFQVPVPGDSSGDAYPVFCGDDGCNILHV